MKIERPILTAENPMASIALIDTWIAKTTDLLNYTITQLEEEVEKLKEGKENGQ